MTHQIQYLRKCWSCPNKLVRKMGMGVNVWTTVENRIKEHVFTRALRLKFDLLKPLNYSPLRLKLGEIFLGHQVSCHQNSSGFSRILEISDQNSSVVQ